MSAIAKRRAALSREDWLLYRGLVAKIGRLELSGCIEAFAPRVLALFRGVPRAVFELIDEEIGEAVAHYNGRGCMVRRVRNDFHLGRELWANLRR